MPPQLLFVAYILAAVAALVILLGLGPKAWYFHVIGLMAGLLAGLLPSPLGPAGNVFYLVTGTACIFLLVWGGGGIVFRRRHRKQLRPAFSTDRKERHASVA